MRDQRHAMGKSGGSRRLCRLLAHEAATDRSFGIARHARLVLNRSATRTQLTTVFTTYTYSSSTFLRILVLRNL